MGTCPPSHRSVLLHRRDGLVKRVPQRGAVFQHHERIADAKPVYQPCREIIRAFHVEPSRHAQRVIVGAEIIGGTFREFRDSDITDLQPHDHVRQRVIEGHFVDRRRGGNVINALIIPLMRFMVAEPPSLLRFDVRTGGFVHQFGYSCVLPPG